MPKLVDADLRRQEVAEAVFRIARRDGLEHASLRNVATEAGLAIGSVRHYFADQADVMIFAMRHFVDRMTQRLLDRIANRPDPTASPHERAAALEGLLSELLPLDEVRREETAVWLAFTASARTRPELQPYAHELYVDTRRMLQKVLAGFLAPALDLDTETERLYALIDGLAVHGVLQPDRAGPPAIRAALRRHLAEITVR
jgi:AcrR family transcriptional regulator